MMANYPKEPSILKDLVSYQEDSIVSRIILKNRSGNVTLFAFSAGQSLSEHKTAHDVLVTVIDGKGIFELDGQQHQVEEGQVFLFPANIPHAVYAEAPFKMMLTMIKESKESEVGTRQ